MSVRLVRSILTQKLRPNIRMADHFHVGRVFIMGGEPSSSRRFNRGTDLPSHQMRHIAIRLPEAKVLTLAFKTAYVASYLSFYSTLLFFFLANLLLIVQSRLETRPYGKRPSRTNPHRFLRERASARHRRNAQHLQQAPGWIHERDRKDGRQRLSVVPRVETLPARRELPLEPYRV